MKDNIRERNYLRRGGTKGIKKNGDQDSNFTSSVVGHDTNIRCMQRRRLCKKTGDEKMKTRGVRERSYNIILKADGSFELVLLLHVILHITFGVLTFYMYICNTFHLTWYTYTILPFLSCEYHLMGDTFYHVIFPYSFFFYSLICCMI